MVVPSVAIMHYQTNHTREPVPTFLDPALAEEMELVLAVLPEDHHEGEVTIGPWVALDLGVEVQAEVLNPERSVALGESVQ